MKMNKKLTYLFGVVLLLAFAAFSLKAFDSSLTAYVPYETARQESNRAVQVAGALVQGSTSYDDSTHYLHFTLVDEESGDTLPVRYEGLKPANFNEAISIVAIGRYDAATTEFHAKKLLVKCPSKYQGAEVKEYG
jgi:cytochrome c-type biogenesis protein CcmE